MQLLHIDVTILRFRDNSKAYIHVIKDNFSKAILHCTAQASLKTTYTIEALKQVFIQYKDLFPSEVSLMTDDGSENTSIKDWIAQNELNIQCRHVIAQADVPYSNSMVEAANKRSYLTSIMTTSTGHSTTWTAEHLLKYSTTSLTRKSRITILLSRLRKG